MSDYPIYRDHGVTVRPTGVGGYDLLDPDGTPFAWVSENALARTARPTTAPPVAADPRPEPPALRGPFTSREAGDGRYEVVGADGHAGVLVTGRTNAEFVTRMLNLAHRHGKV